MAMALRSVWRVNGLPDELQAREAVGCNGESINDRSLSPLSSPALSFLPLRALARSRRPCTHRFSRMQRALHSQASYAGAPVMHAPTRPQRASRCAAVTTTGVMRASEWRSAFKFLVEKGVKGVSAKEAASLSRWPRSYVLVDVRRADQFETYHVKGSRSAPLYQLIEGNSPVQLLRRAAFQAQSVDPVEPNDAFLADVARAAGNAPGVVLLDAEGGSLVATKTSPSGRLCRSLAAAYTLLSSGQFKGSVVFLEGGLNDAFASGAFDGEGAADGWQRSNRTPNAASARSS